MTERQLLRLEALITAWGLTLSSFALTGWTAAIAWALAVVLFVLNFLLSAK